MREFIVFLDENHCRNPHLLAALDDAGVRSVKHLDLFAAGVEDIAWLPEVGRSGWCLLTADKRIRSHALEREMVREHAVRMFYFANNDVSGREMGAALRKALPAMRRFFEQEPPPFFASLNRAGQVTLRSKL